jgi:hypothetical protein
VVLFQQIRMMRLVDHMLHPNLEKMRPMSAAL